MSRIGWSFLTAACIAGWASAAPRVAPPTPPAKRKPAQVTFTPDQLFEFAKAVIADKRGDLVGAEHHYENVNRGAPIADVHWNLADVALRRERLNEAVKQLEKYIALVESEADKQAAAKLIDEIKARPYRLGVSGTEPGGVLFVDGVRFPQNAPVVMELDPGSHVVDWIGREGYERTQHGGSLMGSAITRMGEHEAARNVVRGGNVILAMNDVMPSYGVWERDGVSYNMNARIQLAPGHYDLPYYDGKLACTNLVFDVPRDGVVYVFVTASRPKPGTYCHAITITQTKVKP